MPRQPRLEIRTMNSRETAAEAYSCRLSEIKAREPGTVARDSTLNCVKAQNWECPPWGRRWKPIELRRNSSPASQPSQNPYGKAAATGNSLKCIGHWRSGKNQRAPMFRRCL
jgi:hypothetical protein